MRRTNRPTAVVTEIQIPVTPPTPGAAAADMLESVQREAAYESKYAQDHLDQWAAKFANDPTHAFSWSKEAFEQAARKRVAQEILAWIALSKERADEYAAPSDLKIMRIVRRELYSAVMRGARSPERSTSPQSNEMATCLTAKRAEWLEKLDNKFEYRNLTA